MRRRHPLLTKLLIVAVAWPLVAVAVGCGGKPQSTRLTPGDLQDTAGAMAQSLAADAAIAQRDAASEPWVVSMERVQNLTNDPMTPAEGWYLVRRLRASLPLRSLGEAKNIRFVLPPEGVAALRDDAAAEGLYDFAQARQPTHTLGGRLESLTRVIEKGRTDSYLGTFQLVDLGSGEPTWQDRFEIKRNAIGSVRD